MKTVSELQSRWWYRFIKVLYTGCFLLVFIFFLASFYYENKSYPMNYSKTRITCLDSQKSFDIDKSELNLVDDKLSNEQQEALALKYCRGKEIARQSSIDLSKYGARRVSNPFLSGSFLISNSVFTASYGVMEEKIDWSSLLIQLLYLIVTEAFLFELFRRIFYYIVLGSLRPKKSII